ncbi:MAG: type II toxin-antitoxin system RelE/ParE family toxin [Desulfobacterales bacterium]|nr:type II toxin-antitoxin system RelE/ParE family toxin [Desulfobacterales bacterium]
MKANYPIQVVFYRTETGIEPTREWLKGLSHSDRKIIGEDIKTVQFGWPLGMPLIKKLDTGLWEIRSRLDNRIARVIFTIYEEFIVLLHGFIKKSQKTPTSDLKLAKKRMLTLRR